MAADVWVRKREAAISRYVALDRDARDHITGSGRSAPSDRWKKVAATREVERM